ncbi:MAG: flagellar protein FlgN [Tissierellia bacterium]|nr:flagellar protein FlgN [Tissierellia bacterium]
MTREKIDQLISLTKEKIKLLERFQSLTKEQKLEIEKEDVDSIDLILDKKDAIMKEIDKLDVRFMDIFSQIKKDESVENIYDLDREKYPNLVELKKAVKDVSSLLMAISLLDEENTKMMKKKLADTKMELKRVKEGMKAYKGYNVPFDGSILIDEKK